MAFASKDLEFLAGGGAGLTLYGYRTDADNLAAVQASGYFNDAAGQVQPGDIVFVRATDGNGMASVATNAAGVVDMADVVNLSANAG